MNIGDKADFVGERLPVVLLVVSFVLYVLWELS